MDDVESYTSDTLLPLRTVVEEFISVCCSLGYNVSVRRSVHNSGVIVDIGYEPEEENAELTKIFVYMSEASLYSMMHEHFTSSIQLKRIAEQELSKRVCSNFIFGDR